MLVHDIENKILDHIVRTALRNNWLVSVHDGEDWVLVKSKVFADIRKDMQSTDEDCLAFRGSNDRRLGRIFLIYGNDGHDVISNHTCGDVDFDQFTDEMNDYTTNFGN